MELHEAPRLLVAVVSLRSRIWEVLVDCQECGISPICNRCYRAPFREGGAAPRDRAVRCCCHCLYRRFPDPSMVAAWHMVPLTSRVTLTVRSVDPGVSGGGPGG